MIKRLIAYLFRPRYLVVMDDGTKTILMSYSDAADFADVYGGEVVRGDE
jgi:hypothetical protein